MLAKELLSKLQLHGRTLFDEDKQALFFNWTCAGFTVCFTGGTLKGRFTAMGDKGPAFPGMPEPKPDYPVRRRTPGTPSVRAKKGSTPSGW